MSKASLGYGLQSCFDLLFHADQESTWEVECDLVSTEMYSHARHNSADLSVSHLTRTFVSLDNVFSAGSGQRRIVSSALACATYDENNCKKVNKGVGTNDRKHSHFKYNNRKVFVNVSVFLIIPM